MIALTYTDNWFRPYFDQGLADLIEYLSKWARMYDFGGPF